MGGLALPLSGLFLRGGSGVSLRWTSLFYTLDNETTGVLTLVFRPGDPNPAENVYTDWPTLYADVSGLPGARIILIDNSLISPAPAVIPAGTYDLSGVSFIGRLDMALATPLHFADGAILTGIASFADGLEVHSLSSLPVLSVPAGQTRILKVQFATSLQADGAAPFVHVEAGGALVLACLFGAELRTGAQAVVDIDGGGQLLLSAFLHTTVQADTISGAGPLTVELWDAASIIDPAQAGHAGPTTVTLGELAQLVRYDPSAPPNTSWKPQPTTVAEALDRMSAVVAILNGGPIPA